MIYLATPYSHPDTAIRCQRFDIVNRVAAHLMNEGMLIFSPISHTHPIAIAGGLPTGWEYWKKYDEEMLRICSQMIVLTQDGWEESRGVSAEIELAKRKNISIYYMTLAEAFAYKGLK